MPALMLGNEAVARGCWEAGLALGTGYPGTPSTEILEALAQLEDVHTQWAPNEKVALEVAVGASLAGVRSIVTMKHVGLNVAADPFFSASYMGVGGGLVVVSADDPGMHSSQDEQDNRHFARAAKVVMVEPSDPEDARWMTREAFALSERFDTPVLLRMTTRVCHQTAVVKPEPRRAPPSRGYVKDIAKHVLLPAHARQRRPAVEKRLVEARAFGEASDLWNPIMPGVGRTGVVTSGVSYGYVREVAPDFPVLTCSRVLSLAALQAGLDVKMSEVHGMSQRGGSVDTHVRIGRDVPSAMIPLGGAHMVVAFEKLEALRYLGYLRGDGVVYACPLEVHPLGRSLKKGEGYLADVDAVLEERAPRLVWVDAIGIADALGDPRLVNMAMLGAISRRLPIGPADWDAAVRQRFSGSAAVKCLEAFDLGGDILFYYFAESSCSAMISGEVGRWGGGESLGFRRGASEDESSPPLPLPTSPEVGLRAKPAL